MSESIDADDLALLAESFEAAMAEAPGPGEADEALYDLGWIELLDADPGQGAALAFSALGRTNSAATLLDDVMAHAIGIQPSLDVCVMLPASLHTNFAMPDPDDPPLFVDNDPVIINAVVSSRIDRAAVAILATDIFPHTQVAAIEAKWVRVPMPRGIDPDRAYRHLSIRVRPDELEPMEADGDWETAMTVGRMALARQLIAGARWMLAEARQHALDRVQFGRPVASFQAIRHKLAESLVLIEGAESLAEASLRDPDPMVAGLAKSMAGQAALTTAGHAQQVLAGIGFTAEHRFHRWFKRMLVLDALFDSARSLPTEIGRDLMIYGTVPRLIQL